MKRFVLTAIAGLALATSALAGIQVGAGDPAPAFKGKLWFNHDKASLDDLRGKVVFLDVWRTWCRPCTAQIPHLNEMQSEYGDQGLVVLGMTDEGKSLVTKHMEKHSMSFPIVVVDPDEEDNYGITGFPTSMLIDAEGTIVWRGHPGRFEESFGIKRLEELLAQTSSFPELPKEFSKVGKQLDKGELGKAWVDANKILARKQAPELTALQEQLEGMVVAKLERAEALVEDGAFGQASLILQDVDKRFAGMPVAERAEGLLDELKADKGAKDDIAAADKYDDALAKWRKGDFEKALKAMQAVVKKYPGTYTADLAYAMIDRHES
jgi:thiol-disulfide isomerase/thioredoxin